MAIAADLKGKTFGNLYVVERTGTNSRGEALWICLCSCGREHTVKSPNLTRGKTKSCGQCNLVPTGPKGTDMTGGIYGRLTVVGRKGKNSSRDSMWNCICSCGNRTDVTGRNLRLGKIRSCGCLKVEVDNGRIGPNNPNYKHNLTEVDRTKRRNIFGYKDWAKGVKEKGGFRCAVSGTLVSHHLESYHAHPELRLVVDNGVCLCESCHKGFHRRFGFFNNTTEQFCQYKEYKLGRI
jgi:hypothetical protein